MKLKSGKTTWQKSFKSSVAQYPPLKENISCDVLIVGGGIFGALTAYYLSRRKKLSIALVEKGDIGMGSTVASTALLLYQLDVMMTELVPKIGKKKAVEAYTVSRESLFHLGKLIRKLKISCGFRKKKVLYVASSGSDVIKLEKEYDALKKHGFRVNFLNKVQLKRAFSIGREAGMIVHEAAEVDPYRLTKSLADLAASKGVRIYSHTEVEKCRSGKICNTLSTKEGYRIGADKVVFATGYESMTYLKQYLKKKIVRLKSSYVIGSKPLPKLKKHWLKDYMVWETAHPYLYIRSSTNRQIIVGGEDENVLDPKKRDALISAKSEALKRKFKNMIPDFDFKTEYKWAATFGETKDGLGYVGLPSAKSKNIFFALGFGGNGTTFSIIAASIISRMIEGKKVTHRDLFSFDR